jgi:TP901 family phage tail tape measure protein
MLSKISAQTQEETSQQIIAIKNAYELSSGEMQGVADKLTQVDSQSATSTKELATAIQHTAESARLAGTDFDNLVSYIATVSETSRKSASSIGESFKFRGLIV